MNQQLAMERQALEQLRKGDLRGARGTLVLLSKLRPHDDKLQHRLRQVTDLIAKQSETHQRMQSEPLRFAHAYIQAGRLEEGLRLLRAAIAKDPSNERLKGLALQVARRIKSSGLNTSTPGPTTSGPAQRVVLLRQLLKEVRARRRAPSNWLDAQL